MRAAPHENITDPRPPPNDGRFFLRPLWHLSVESAF